MSAADMFWAAPPVSRTLTAGAVALSVPVHLGLLAGYHVVWITQHVFTLTQIPEIWRLVTAFLLTGPKFGLILDPYFLYTYGSQLERGSPQFSDPGSFLVYVVFVCTVILVTCGLGLGGFSFLSPLSLALAYTWAQENPNQQVTFYIITFSAKFLPYAMLVLAFVMGSPEAAMYEATGLVAAHLYLLLTKIWPEYGGGRNLIYTPEFVKAWFADPGAPTQRTYGTAFDGRRTQAARNVPQTQGRGNSFTSGFSGAGGSVWNARGQGHRLGGE